MVQMFDDLKQLAGHEGQELGPSSWLKIDQRRIDRFAEATDDFQWIHVDPERTARELGMATIAHGFLTLSLITKFKFEIMRIKSVKRTINYGCNKIRFTNMVPVGSRVRGRMTLKRCILSEASLRTIADVTVEIEGEDKPALIAETITLFYE